MTRSSMTPMTGHDQDIWQTRMTRSSMTPMTEHDQGIWQTHITRSSMTPMTGHDQGIWQTHMTRSRLLPIQITVIFLYDTSDRTWSLRYLTNTHDTIQTLTCAEHCSSLPVWQMTHDQDATVFRTLVQSTVLFLFDKWHNMIKMPQSLGLLCRALFSSCLTNDTTWSRCHSL